MLEVCSGFLKAYLHAAMGPNAPCFDRLAALKAHAGSRVCAALADTDTMTYRGTPSRNLDTKLEDTLVFERALTFQVIMAEQSAARLDPLFCVFLAELGRGLRYDGHYIALEVGEADWVDAKDSILKAEIAVQFPVIFTGGVYRAARMARIERITIQREDQHGN